MEGLVFDEDDDRPVYESHRIKINTSQWMRLKCFTDFPAMHWNYQSPALQEMDKRGAGCVMAYDRWDDKKKTAVKGFSICALVRFFELYRNLMLSSRVHYELIIMGMAYDKEFGSESKGNLSMVSYFKDWDVNLINSSGLCHFHMDIETCKLKNPEYDFEKWFAILIDECREFYKTYLDEPDLPLVRLCDSSNEKKYSRHALFKSCTGDMFLNNAHCGAFYRHFFLLLVQKYGLPERNPFFMWSKDEHITENAVQLKVCIADQSIYTRNREYRLIGSTKMGQQRELLPYCPITKTKTPIGEMRVEQFLNNLVQFTSLPEVGVIHMKEPSGSDPEWTSKNLSTRVMFDADGKAFLKEESKHNHTRKINYRNIVNISSNTPEVIREIGKAIATHHCESDYVYTLQPMNFGYSFYYGSGKQSVAPCPHNGKPHKGNHIAYNAILLDQNFERKMVFYISCLDPDCRDKPCKQKPLRTILSPEMMQRLESHLDELMNHKDVTPEMLQCLF